MSKKPLPHLGCVLLTDRSTLTPHIHSEAAILEHELVAETSVVGRKHDQWGEVVVAVVRLKEDSTSKSNAMLTIEELRTFLASRLAPYKLPQVLRLVKTLPKNAIGKINKKTLLQDLGIED